MPLVQSRSADESSGSVEGSSAGGGTGTESTPESAEVFDVKKIELPRHRRPRKQGGKRATAQSAGWSNSGSRPTRRLST